ncbi:porphobilinogen deaminase [Recurvomyces mirabilis]|uniref:Porphobilinogen deaminase n=1 Tax=Recurvomyces mirabilis TaxID=574656 RepID=A0AAE0WYH3_9PEZI|nr:porphobilinogen deaminase [Recurvomyces mirabilis]KAK5162172.1 porphobilinogen deaminase [Recurvomyces mirabilis]
MPFSEDAPLVNATITESSVPASQHHTSHNGEKQTFHIGTRQSILARVQADLVLQALKQAWPSCHFEVHAMSTTGDNNQKTALHKFNEKALWTQELEVLLQNGELDLIVHSLKDMPTQLPIDCQLGAVTKRGDARDALVIKPGLAAKCKSLADLPEGSVVGTSSLRRRAQLKRHYTHLKFADIRGNIGTRLAKLDNPDSEYSATILAAAGLQRVGMTNRITSYLTKEEGGMLHAVGQGALGIETRKDDTRTAELLGRINDEATMRQILVERSLMRTLEGGCSVPIGVETEWVSRVGVLDSSGGIGTRPKADYHKASGVAENGESSGNGYVSRDGAAVEVDVYATDELIMRALVVSLDGDEVAETEARRRILSREDADEFGWEVAQILVKKGADRILQAISLNRGIIGGQDGA